MHDMFDGRISTAFPLKLSHQSKGNKKNNNMLLNCFSNKFQFDITVYILK